MIGLDFNGFGANKLRTVSRHIPNAAFLWELCASLQPASWDRIIGRLKLNLPTKPKGCLAGLRFVVMQDGEYQNIPYPINQQNLCGLGKGDQIQLLDFETGKTRPIDVRKILFRFVEYCSQTGYNVGTFQLFSRAVPYDYEYRVEFKWYGTEGEVLLTYIPGRAGTRIPFLMKWFADIPPLIEAKGWRFRKIRVFIRKKRKLQNGGSS